MNKTPLVVFLLLMLVSCDINHQTQIEATTQQQLQENIISAINSNNKEHYIQSFHPSVIEAITDKNQPYMDHIVSKHLEHSIPSSAKIRFNSHRELDMVKSLVLLTPSFSFTIEPTSALVINYDKKFTRITLVIPVVYDSGLWYQVMDIPNDTGMAEFVSTQKKSQAINKEIDNMDPALYERMSQMIRNTGSFVEPGELYAKETGCEKQHGYFIAIKIRETIQGK